MPQKPKQPSKATKKVIPMFVSMYETYHPGERYLVNWPLIRAAEKVGTFYSVPDVGRALEYYFRTRSRHDMWEFIQNIDSCLNGSRLEEESRKRIDKLLKRTKKRMEEIGFEHRSSTDY